MSDDPSVVTRVVLDPWFTIGEIDRRLFGSFVEHMPRCVYTGIFESGHPRADGRGFRRDVLELVRELGVSLVRYPGGNFVSGHRWEDGVGPVERRPTRLDLAWRSVEPNTFGLGEFMGWVRAAQAEPMLAVNLGTRGIAAAAALVEYANHPGGTAWSQLRHEHGDPEPYGIRLWCLGNEMGGPWQLGRCAAAQYGARARETARAMRRVDPGIELVACGSSGRQMPTFGRWEDEVLEQAYDDVDYLSLHAYYEEHDGDLDSFLASSVDMDAFIDEVVATCDAVRARKGSGRRIRLSFDEWNVWYQRRFDPAAREEFVHAPRLIEDEYDVADAVVVGSFLMSLLRHADRVAIACQAQLVNVIAPIRTEPGGPAWRQTIFDPFALTARLAPGSSLRVEPRGPLHRTRRHGDVPVVDVAATLAEDGEMVLFAVNRDRRDAQVLEVDLRAVPDAGVAEHWQLADDDPRARNTEQHPERVRARPVDTAILADGLLRVPLPPVSWSALRLRRREGTS